MHGFPRIWPQYEAHHFDEMRLECVGSLSGCDVLGEELRSHSSLVLPCRSHALSVTLRTSAWRSVAALGFGLMNSLCPSGLGLLSPSDLPASASPKCWDNRTGSMQLCMHGLLFWFPPHLHAVPVSGVHDLQEDFRLVCLAIHGLPPAAPVDLRERAMAQVLVLSGRRRGGDS